MTDHRTTQAPRGRIFDRVLTEGAASREAARAGHPEVGFEHLLLGVLVNGGPAARLLMDAGVGLSEARSAIDALLREDLALLGVDTPLPVPGGAGDEAAAPHLPLGPRLTDLVAECPTSGGDRVLLAALIDDEGGRVRRLLDRLGADTDRIRRDLGEPAGSGAATTARAEGGDPFAGSGPAPEGWEHSDCVLDVPVSAGRVWDLVSDPARRDVWDAGAASSRVLDDGSVELTPHHGTAYRESIADSVPGSEITWAREGDEDAAPRTLRIAVEPLGEHARVHLRLGWPNALRGRIANRVVRWFVRQNLRMNAQSIVHAAAS